MDSLVAVHSLKFHAREGDDLFAADVRGEFDGVGELGDDLIAEFGIAGTFGKTMTADEGDVEAQCLHIRVVFAVDALHANEADVFAVLGQDHRVHRLEAPAHDGVPYAVVFDDVGRISSSFIDGLSAETRSSGGSKSGGEEMAAVHGWRSQTGPGSLSYAEGGEDDIQDAFDIDLANDVA